MTNPETPNFATIPATITTNAPVGPPIWTGLFGYFVSPAAPVIFPGAAFLASAAVFALALILAIRWLTTEHPAFQSSAVVG